MGGDLTSVQNPGCGFRAFMGQKDGNLTAGQTKL